MEKKKFYTLNANLMIGSIYCEQADEYYGFIYLIVCLLSGEIVETLGYYEKELFTICEEIMIESAKEI